jgi:hypothetical protein
VLSGRGPVQIAYHVPDVESAARHYAAEFGWGPFFVLKHIPLEFARYRGREAVFDHSSAYGQAGDMMIEFITQHGDDPSAIRDMYESDQSGVHHVAFFIPDLQQAMAEFRQRGYEFALEARTTTGVDFVMADARADLGHMIELYENRDDLAKFYAFVRREAEAWDGRNPVRLLG